MWQWIESSAGTLRPAAFAIAAACLLAAERMWPRRGPRPRGRWWNNLALLGIDVLCLRLLLPLAAVAAAAFAGQRELGLFHAVTASAWVSGLATVVLLDLGVWLQHVLFHRFDVLWRFHRVHHADPTLDVTTGLRFHPVEIALSLVWKFGLVVALGAPVAAVILFEVILNLGAMFSHANVRLPGSLDRVLRRVIVTPDVHRVHHSVDGTESRRNFGFFLVVWDRLFGTYLAQPRASHEIMALGVAGQTEGEGRRVGSMLVMPLRDMAPESGVND